MSRSVTSPKPRSAYSRSAAARMADRVRSLDISGPRLRSCNSNTCMKLSFEELEKSIHVCERVAFPARTVPSRPSSEAAKCLAANEWRADSAAQQIQKLKRGAPHELRYVRQAKGMAGPRARVYGHPCSSRSADLRQAGCGG